MIQAIRTHRVSFLLILTVLMGLTYSFLLENGYFPCDGKTPCDIRFNHWGGKEGFKLHWHWWLVNHYLIGFVLLWAITVPKKSEIDRDILTCYITFDIFSFYNYLQWGWPEPVARIVTGFAMACIIMAFLRIFDYDQK